MNTRERNPQVAWSHTDHVLACAAYGAANALLAFVHDPALQAS